MAEEIARDPDFEWLDYVPPQGVVAAPAVLRDLGLIPERQTAVETGEIKGLLEGTFDAWAFAERVLGWDARFVAGAPGGPDLPTELVVVLPEQNDRLVPTWGVKEPGDGGGWQMLVRVEEPRIAPDARHTLEGWEATPHQRLERLLRETGVPAGLLITLREARTGDLEPEIRLVCAPRGETSGWQTFPVRPMATVAGRPILGGLKLLLDRSRLFTDRTERRLPALLHASRLAQDAVSEKLSGQVLGALFELLRGLDAAEPDLIRKLAAERRGHLYEGLLAVLMRLVFVLYAEDRDLLPSRRDDEARRIYDAGYSVRGLHARLTEDAALNPDTMDERRGGWGRLVALFRLIYAGHPSGFVRARRGGLFDPGRYPFLEGRAEAAEAPSVLKLADGCLLRILDGLLILKERGRPPERLSYRTLDVEQIGSVYETVMGFEARLAAGRSIAVKGAKGLPFFADLDALIAKKGKERVKAIKGETGLSLSGAKAAAVEAAADVDALAQALASSVDLRGSPGAVPLAAGSPILQPTDERRRSGSHYTPRSLTAPIVEHALAPAFERLGENAMPEQILDLKVCDPAMGSGAFLVEACRAIADRLVKAWEIHKGTRPAIPLDEDEALHARRLVAQRCLYGVDKNPRAVELAKLSLWLATLARDHEFTFLDHALKCGDSLVGLDLDQITAVHWDHSQAPTFVGRMVRQHLAEAEAERAKLRAHAEDATEAELRPMLRASEGKLEAARLVGDGVIAAFFSSDKPRARVQGLVQFQQDLLASGDWDVRARALGKTLREGPLPIPPFHWPVEFPEVFSRENAGFDAILGNPPFLSGSRTSQIFGSTYFQFLLTRFRGARHQCDIVAFFFRLAFELLRHGGSAGLIATNTLAQGDTRASSLEHMINEGATIYRVKKRLSWPGEAAVVVSPTHFIKGNFNPKLFDGRPVERISAFLLPGEVDTTPTALGSNPYFSKGSQIYGQGFVIDDNDATANPIAVLRFFSEAEKSFVFPVFGGIDLNQRSILSHEKWVINVSGIESEAELDHLSAISQLLRNTVKPERDLLPDNANNRPLKRRWWTYQAPRPELYKRLALKRRCIAHAEVSPHLAFRFVETGPVYIKTVIVIDSDADSTLAVLQSRAHELWARFFASSMKDDLRYTPSDCFRTFPFPEDFLTDSRLEAAGEAYHAYRAAVMIERDEGLTRTYNRFHDQREIAADFARLRELHAAMDCGVLTAYGWDDLAARAAPEFHPREDDPDKTRLDWPQAFKDEVLARLLDLNRTRAAEENALGLTAASEDDADANDDGVDED